MQTSTRIHRTALAAAMACALVGPAGNAVAAGQDLRNPDNRIGTSSLAGTTSPKQDLRSPDARDAAASTLPEARTLPGPPTWPVNPQPITPAPAVEPIGDGGGVDWAPIGAGIAGGLLAVGGIAALAGRRRSHPLRVGA